MLVLILFDDNILVTAVGCLALSDREPLVTFDLLLLISQDMQVFILEDFFFLIAAFLAVLFVSDNQVTIINYAFHALVLDPHFHVTFSVDENLLFTLAVVKAPLVKSGPTFGSVALDAGEFVVILVLRIQPLAQVGRHLIGVVHTANDNRLIGI